MTHILYCGLGNMGDPMARHLLKANHKVTVYNRTTEKARQFAATHQCHFLTELTCASLRKLSEPISHIILCVGKDDDVRQCLTQDPQLLDACADQVQIIDHTTTSAVLAQDMFAYTAKFNASYVDAPVSGGEQGAVNGQLTIMAGGAQRAVEQAQAICRPYTKTFTHMGGSGNGQTTKMVNQVCVAGLLAGLAEGMTLAQQSGLNIEQVVDTLAGGAAGSWQMKNRGKTMAQQEFDFGFAIHHMLKDLGICQQQAEQLGLNLPITEQVTHQYQALFEQGYGDLDTSALMLAIKNGAEPADRD